MKTKEECINEASKKFGFNNFTDVVYNCSHYGEYNKAFIYSIVDYALELFSNQLKNEIIITNKSTQFHSGYLHALKNIFDKVKNNFNINYIEITNIICDEIEQAAINYNNSTNDPPKKY